MPTRSAKKSAAKKASPKQSPQVVPYFSKQAMDFLRQLKRNNRREWFEARREIYERELKAPMLALIEKITEDMPEYAPGACATGAEVDAAHLSRHALFGGQDTV